MTQKYSPTGDETAQAITASGLSIYDQIPLDSPLFFDIAVLENHLRTKLRGLNLAYVLRTRSKVGKSAVCRAMGYPVPTAFRRTQPRFPGQDLDVYIQKADNVQIWNEKVVPSRRYAFIRLDQKDIVVDVRVVTGEALARLDRTGALTQKYQAKRRTGRTGSKLVSQQDSATFVRLFRPVSALPPTLLARLSPAAIPVPNIVLGIEALYARLLGMVGYEITDPGHDQERTRGAALHQLACQMLGLGPYADRGQVPDIRCQALEVKLQTSPTIDLGLVAPDSKEPAQELQADARHCDMRYAVIYAMRLSPDTLRISGVVLATGEDFFSEFQRFEGRVLNKKLQIRLPADFFVEAE